MQGLKKHFQVDWKRVTNDDKINSEDPMVQKALVAEFTGRAAEQAPYYSWAEYDRYKHFCASERYYAWVDEGSILWQRAGYQRNADGHKVPNDVKNLKLSFHTQRLEFLRGIDLESGKEPWTQEAKPYLPALIEGHITHNPRNIINVGWETFCYFKVKSTDLTVHNLRTGKWLHDISLDTFGGVQPNIQIHKVGGEETFICWGDIKEGRSLAWRILFFDAVTGQRTQDIKTPPQSRPTSLQYSALDAKLQFSHKRHDKKFAITSVNFQVAMIQYFELGPDGNFTQTTTDCLSMSVGNPGHSADFHNIAIDPFRGFMAATTSSAAIFLICRLKAAPLTGNRALGANRGPMLKLPAHLSRTSGSIGSEGLKFGLWPQLVAKGIVIARDRMFVRCENSDGRGEPIIAVFEFGFQDTGDDEATKQEEYSQIFHS
ncbi:hypothetical protein BDW74DRAFT_183276 [Aspergillus multicolor]|uniref:uncharacterized protein n=1 Tax=Aspergillus multicolor TaxID=41759 RepID=UPI003CCE2573